MSESNFLSLTASFFFLVKIIQGNAASRKVAIKSTSVFSNWQNEALWTKFVGDSNYNQTPTLGKLIKKFQKLKQLMQQHMLPRQKTFVVILSHSHPHSTQKAVLILAITLIQKASLMVKMNINNHLLCLLLYSLQLEIKIQPPTSTINIHQSLPF